MAGNPETALPRRVEATDASIDEAAALLAAGRLVGMPTETVYGLACDALNAEAAAAVFASKDRPSFDPLIVHVASEADAWALVDDGPAIARQLSDAFWPGPLTLVLPKPADIPGIVTAGLDTVGVRVPAHPIARRLIAKLGERIGRPGAIAAPSANPFGGVSPTWAEHVRVPCDLVLDGGPCSTGVESTVVRSMDDGTVAILRLGGVSVEALAGVVGEANVRLVGGEHDDASAAAGLASPGTTLQHYAPRTAMRLLPNRHALPDALPNSSERCGVLGVQLEQFGLRDAKAIEDLSPAGDLTQAAAALFAAMHRLDAADLDVILAVPVPEVGLGRAINDRLRRASR